MLFKVIRNSFRYPLVVVMFKCSVRLDFIWWKVYEKWDSGKERECFGWMVKASNWTRLKIFFSAKRCVLDFSFARSLKALETCFKSNIDRMALVVQKLDNWVRMLSIIVPQTNASMFRWLVVMFCLLVLKVFLRVFLYRTGIRHVK